MSGPVVLTAGAWVGSNGPLMSLRITDPPLAVEVWRATRPVRSLGVSTAAGRRLLR